MKIISKAIYHTIDGLDFYLKKLDSSNVWELFYWDNLFASKIVLFTGSEEEGLNQLKRHGIEYRQR